MSFNLVDAAKGLFTNDLITKASSYLGESETSVNKAIAGIVPSFLGGITERAATNDGAGLVANLSSEYASPGFIGNLDSFDTGEGGLLGKGAALLRNLFGETKSNQLSNLISNFSGVKPSSAYSLLSISAPLMTGLLGNYAASKKLDAGGLSSFLNSQKSNIANVIPPGLNLDNFLGGFNTRTTDTVSHVEHTTTHHTEMVKTHEPTKILLPLIILVLLGAASWYLAKDGCSGKERTETVHKTEESHPEAATDVVTTALASGAGRVDSLTGDFIYDQGETVTISLPGNGEKLTVGKNSTEYKLVNFLNDESAMLDSAKGNWFEFTNVRFKTGEAEITETSMVQLKNLVAISKAFPNARFKIGGYTDNTGDAASNIALSQKRADAVTARLKKSGISNSALESAKGYGQEWPLADNTTPEGRAQNRRVAVNVKAK